MQILLAVLAGNAVLTLVGQALSLCFVQQYGEGVLSRLAGRSGSHSSGRR